MLRRRIRTTDQAIDVLDLISFASIDFYYDALRTSITDTQLVKYRINVCLGSNLNVTVGSLIESFQAKY